MELILGLVVLVVVGTLIYFNREAKSLDLNKDGKVDLADAKTAVNNAVSGVKKTADLNKDGKVDAADAKVAATKAKTGAKKAAVKAKTAVKKATTRGRKPKA
jgi:hypothetical protein